MASLADVARRFGLAPLAIRFAGGRHNRHWRIRTAAGVYVLRRFGVWAETPGDAEWELAAVDALAGAGLPVPAAIGPLQVVDGAQYVLMPWIGGRVLGEGSVSDTAYERLGEMLAEFHMASAHVPAPLQRPEWTSNVDGALPPDGGRVRRDELLAALAEVDTGMAARLVAAAAQLDARRLPTVFADAPRRLVHGDFSPWNVRVRGGRLVGLIDFDLAHLDVRAADVAMARRGYHDGVVRGYLRRAPLTVAELASLDALWLGGSLRSVWRVIESRVAEGRLTTHGLEWNLEQLDKTRPYDG